jgi:hypothetical protein
MKLKNIIRNRDMFGYRVELNFNEKGSTHKTLCGGLVSIFVMAILMIFVLYDAKKMLLEEDDTLRSMINDQDLED